MFGISGNSCIGIVLLRSLSRFRGTYIPCSSSNSFPIHSYTRILYYLYRKKVVYNFDQILFTHFYYQTSVKLTKLSSNQPMLSLDIYAFQYFIILIFFFFYSLIVQLSYISSNFSIPRTIRFQFVALHCYRGAR